MIFLTKKEVAEMLKVNGRTVGRWLDSGALGGYKLGDGKTSLWRIPKSEVDIFLKKHKNNKHEKNRKKKRD